MARVKAGKVAAFRLDLSGEKKLLKALDKLEKAAAKKVIRKGVRAGVNVLLREAKAKVPVDEGDLKKSLRVRVSRKVRKGEYGLRVMTGESDIGTGDQFYARKVEFGTAHMPARPWLRPAYDTARDEAARKAKAAMVDELERVTS